MIIINLLAIYGLVFFLKDSYIFAKPRHYITKINFFLELFSCSFCLGFHCGYLIYLLSNPLNITGIILWGFAGACFSLIVEQIRNKFY